MKPQIALDLIDPALANGIGVKSWTFDELYGRDAQFMDGLDERREAFVGEVPPNFHARLVPPTLLQKPSKNHGERGGGVRSIRAWHAATRAPGEVQNPARYSPGFTEQKAQQNTAAPECYALESSREAPVGQEATWNNRLCSKAAQFH